MALDPRTIDLAKIPGYAFDQLHLLPEMPGLYLVVAEQSVLYVGKAKNIRQRWVRGHHKGLNLGRYYDVARIVSVGCHENELSASEQLFIAWFNCPLNETISQSTRAKLRYSLTHKSLPETADRSATKLDRLIDLLSGFHIEGNAPYEIKEALQIALELRDGAIAKTNPVAEAQKQSRFSLSKYEPLMVSEKANYLQPDRVDCKAVFTTSAVAFIDRERDFDLFWEAVKKKTNKQNARSAFKKVKDVDVQTLITILNKQQDWHMKRNGNLAFLAQPANWLHGRRWEDEYEYL
ncbi:GIY-YIG nuclease family protein [Phormidium sp. FACHB-592]|uniref:GIY-YIG nuclease family protein n=1 Tax=Stenomitos frigidus AS-A4 TaxID=2933935 RepID=A0ABV0KEK2_9CYAN|nr:GIY-YIG nuclease family protein [Phormidium sp. FACHB-592]MBD2076273.1 GIY-YIG nuclease family protein [Phormidium sp. FACHB-592]